VRFQISETIYTADPQRVRRFFESCIRELATEVAIEVTPSSDEVVLHGLGPSPISINRRDIAVFRIRSEAHKTIVDGDITFQASSMLGDLAQDNVVRLKLEAVFEKLRTQVNSEASTPPESLEKTIFAAPAHIATPDEIARPPVAFPGDIRTEIELQNPSEPLDASAFAHVPEHRAFARGGSGTTRWKRSNALITASALSLLLIGAALVYLHGGKRSIFFAANTTPTATTNPGASSATPEKRSTANNLGAVDTGNAAPVENYGDLNTWINSWAAAMRSRDTVAQLSFYSSTADRSGGQDLSSEAMLNNLQSDIRMRKGLWVVKMENIVVERHTNTGVEIRLVKHIIEEPSPHRILESFVLTRLILERENGVWKIFSEQDSPSSALNPEQSR
jgi:hypothetical protein